MAQSSQETSFRLGSKVRVKGFPQPSDPYNQLNFNGLVGTVMNKVRVGFGLNNTPVYSYEVTFEDVQVNHVQRDEKTRKLKRWTTTGPAKNVFEEPYLEAAG